MTKAKQKAAEQLKEIRDTGNFNMFLDRRKVMQYANENNMFFLVSYVGNDVYGKYSELLKTMGNLVTEGKEG